MTQTGGEQESAQLTAFASKSIVCAVASEGRVWRKISWMAQNDVGARATVLAGVAGALIKVRTLGHAVTINHGSDYTARTRCGRITI